MEILIPIKAAHAAQLFPLVKNSRVTDTIAWDGPSSLDDFAAGLVTREKEVADGKKHLFTILDPATSAPAGTADIRPDEEQFRGDMGLWIGEAYQGKGVGTRVVGELVQYGFEILRMEKIEASIFCGNLPSRRIFERNGFRLEGEIRKAIKKRGVPLSEWIFGLTREEYFERHRK